MNKNQKDCWRGAQRIERYGWIQGSYGDYDTGFCVLGSLNLGSLTKVGAEDILRNIYSDVVAWNDDPQRTKEEVIDLLVAASVCDFT